MSVQSNEKIRCPLCGERVSALNYKLHLMFDLKQIDRIRKDHPNWKDSEGSCFLCANIYRREFGQKPLTKTEFYKLIS